MTETEIKKQITDYLKARRFLIFRMNAGRVRIGKRYIYLCPTGTPDLQVVGPPSFWLEVKKPGEEPDEDQLKMHADLRARGHVVHVVWSLDDVIAILEEETDGIPS